MRNKGPNKGYGTNYWGYITIYTDRRGEHQAFDGDIYWIGFTNNIVSLVCPKM